MMNRKKCVWGICVLLCAVWATATNVEKEIGSSQLPFEFSMNVTLFSDVGNTLNVSLGEQSGIAIIKFKNQHTFNESVKKVEVNYSLPFFVNLSSSPYLVRDVLFFKNSNGNISNVTFDVSVLFELLNVTNGTVQSVVEVVGASSFVISTFDSLLPLEIVQNVTVKATPQKQVEVVCSAGLVICPAPFFVNNETNTSIVPVTLSLTNNTAVGTYTGFVVFRVENTSRTVTFDVVVKEGGRTIVSLSEIVNLDKCFESPEAFIECKKKQSVFEAQIASELLRELEKRQGCTNETVIQEKIVVAGSIDEEIFAENQRLRQENRQFSRQALDHADASLDCDLALDAARREQNGKIEDVQRGVGEERAKQAFMVEEAERKLNRKIKILVFGVGGIILIGTFLYKYSKNAWY